MESKGAGKGIKEQEQVGCPDRSRRCIKWLDSRLYWVERRFKKSNGVGRGLEILRTGGVVKGRERGCGLWRVMEVESGEGNVGSRGFEGGLERTKGEQRRKGVLKSKRVRGE
jgi:hypothetical protein